MNKHKKLPWWKRLFGFKSPIKIAYLETVWLEERFTTKPSNKIQVALYKEYNELTCKTVNIFFDRLTTQTSFSAQRCFISVEAYEQNGEVIVIRREIRY